MDPMIPDAAQALYSWNTLGTVGGSAALVLMVTQFLRSGVKKLVNFPMHFFMLIVSFIVLFVTHIFGPGSGIHLADIPMLIGNSFVVATSAYGTYHTTTAIVNVTPLNQPVEDTGNG